mgnify:CR=1 FL=1
MWKGKYMTKLYLSRNTRNLRQRRGLTLIELAEKARVSQSYLSKLENGKIKEPGVRAVLKIAEAFDTSIEHLCFGKITPW